MTTILVSDNDLEIHESDNEILNEDSATVLIVDDAPFMRGMLKKIIESLGHKVVGEAENAKIAFDKYRKLKPDIVTMDLTMPDADGHQGIKWIKKLDPKAKIIVITATGSESNVVKAVSLGAKGFIVKPFSPERVKAELGKVLKL